MGADKLLEVSKVVVRFGGIVALDGVSFDLDEGQILGLIGPNGAGKTTLFNCVSRLYTPVSGDIRFEGRSMLAEPAGRLACWARRCATCGDSTRSGALPPPPQSSF